MFTPITITVPAANTFLRFDIGGCGVIVEKMNTYYDIDSVPKLYFETKTAPAQRLYPQSKYSRPNFTRLWIEGSADAENDTIYLLVSDQSVIQEILPVFSLAEAQDTVEPSYEDTVPSTDIEQYLTTAIGLSTKANWKYAIISVDEADIKFFYNGSSPAPNPGGKGNLLKIGNFIKLSNNEIKNFKFISAEVAAPGYLTFTAYK